MARVRNRVRSWWLSIIAPTDSVTGRPDEVLWCLVAVLSGIPTLLGTPPPSLQEIIPFEPLVYGWAGVLVLCGGTIVVSSVLPIRNRVDAARRHRNASIMLGGASLAYAVAVFAHNGEQAAFAGCIAAGFGLARLLRAAQGAYWIRGQTHPRPAAPWT